MAGASRTAPGQGDSANSKGGSSSSTGAGSSVGAAGASSASGVGPLSTAAAPTAAAPAAAGFEELGKRRRQQVAQFNIGDLSKQFYDRPSAELQIQSSQELPTPAAAPVCADEEPQTGTGENPSGGNAPGAAGSASRHLAALLRMPGFGSSRTHKARRGPRGPARAESHSSSDEDSGTGTLNPMRLLQERSRPSKEGGSWAEPVNVSGFEGWDSIGGRKSQIDALKECTLLPLLYPELYTALGVKPPQGVLLHGPPGCGKTLAARALAGSCHKAGLPVSFFACRGGDIQSKYVGEAEQRLCGLFEAAQRVAPSIIFFDELDGLAPSRSESGGEGGTAHQNAVVATLLALMDGLVGRGQVVVIGATNRPDLLDHALRRPGRFDRELSFGLPDASERLQILQLNVKLWPASSRDAGVGGASEDFLRKLAVEGTAGLSGADLRALCAEAAICSIRRSFPQIYTELTRLRVDPQSLQVTEQDIAVALAAVATPAARARGDCGGSGMDAARAAIEPLAPELTSLLEPSLRHVQQALAQLFPPWGRGGQGGSMGSVGNGQMELPPTFVSRISQALLGTKVLLRFADRQLLSMLEKSLPWGSELPTFLLDVDLASKGSSFLLRTVRAAAAAAPSILLVSCLDQWLPGADAGATLLSDGPEWLWLALNDAFRELPVERPVLVIGTCCSGQDVPAQAPTSMAVAQAKPEPLQRSPSPSPMRTRSRSKRRRVAVSDDEPMPEAPLPESPVASPLSQIRALFDEELVVPNPGAKEAKAFFANLLRQGICSLLELMLEQQHLQGKQPELEVADSGAAGGACLAQLSPEEIARQEQEERYWRRHFRNQVRQVLQALSRYSRFSPFGLRREDLLEAVSKCGGKAANADASAPLTLTEMCDRNDADGYSSVEAVRQDFHKLQANMQSVMENLQSLPVKQLLSHAKELVDKAEAKLDCIDESVVRMLGTMCARQLRRQAGLDRRAETVKAAEKAASSDSALVGETPEKARRGGAAVAVKPFGSQTAKSGTDVASTDMLSAFKEAVQLGVEVLLTEGTGRAASGHGFLTTVLRQGRGVQREFYHAILAAANCSGGLGPGLGAFPLSVAGSRNSCGGAMLLQQLADAFAKWYTAPELSGDGKTVAWFRSHRVSTFLRWAQTHKKGSSLARKLSCDAVTALLAPPCRTSSAD
ncbi:unnamed protein product [Polarella glacialis]|uniref:AAA+ ATPase domain-containing protein n=2 Tax=Polarella glacialis TaxID=89957 RepID=A0A813FN64_POLGL|nr:unnamed protein product [Polarella glacialis]